MPLVFQEHLSYYNTMGHSNNSEDDKSIGWSSNLLVSSSKLKLPYVFW